MKANNTRLKVRCIIIMGEYYPSYIFTRRESIELIKWRHNIKYINLTRAGRNFGKRKE